MKRFPWTNTLWDFLQDAISIVGSKLFLKYQNTHRDKLFICIGDDKLHLFILRVCNVLKLSRHVRDDVNFLTNHVQAMLGLGFKLCTQHENPEDNVLSITKLLITKTFSRLGTYVSVPYLVLHLDRGCWCWDLIMFY